MISAGRGLLAAALILAAPSIAADAAAQRPGRHALLDVADAMGGRERILSIRTLVLEGAGENYNLGQNAAPDAPLLHFAVTGFRRSVDFDTRRWRQEQTREPRFPSGNPGAQRQRFGYDIVAYDILPDSSIRRASARADVDRANELVYHPIGFLQVALGLDAELTEEGMRGSLRHVRMNVGGNKFSIFIDPRTLLPARIEKFVYHPTLGDAILATELSDWREIEGIRHPMRIVSELDGRWKLSDIRLSRISVNQDPGDLALPPELRSAPPAQAPVNVTTEEVAPGVWYLSGQSHHSVAIEMRDHMLLVEAPHSEARTLAVIEKARALRPNKPLRSVINTHHHFDHIGGLRAAISQGLSVIPHERNKTALEVLARRRHFIVQDALATSRRGPRIQGIGVRAVLSDATRTVEIHHIRGSRHAETLLMVYLPAERILIEADVYSPAPSATAAAPAAPFAANLLENIERLGLRIERIVPIHGRVVPLSDLRAAATEVR